MHLLRHLPRFRHAYRALPVLEEHERWSRTEIEAYQLGRLNDIWRHAIANVPYYRELVRNHPGGLPDRFESLDEFRQRVPVLQKAMVRRHPERFLSEQARPGWWARTGGSTGTPMQVYWERDAHRESLRAQYRFHQLWGLDLFDREAYVWGHSAAYGPGLSGWFSRRVTPIEDRLRNRLRLSAYHLGRDDLRDYLKRITAFRPRSVYGYGSAINLLARESEEIGFSCDSLKVFRLTGEPVFPHMVERIERQFGVPAVIEYGSHDCGFTANEFPDRTLRVREDRILAETRPRNDGQHDIILTCLSNPSFPLLRYSIEDTTDAPLKLPEHGFAILSNVAGRNNDLVITRSGRVLHSSRFDALFKYQTRAVRRFRVMQRTSGSLSVSVELHDTAAVVDFSHLEREIRDLVEGYPVQIQIVDSLPSTTAGKHRMVISALAEQVTTNGSIGSVAEEVKPPGGNGHHHASSVEPTAIAGTAGAASTSQRLDPCSKARMLRDMIERPELDFIMEAHNGLSARIAEEAGFQAIWASGLSISAALGVRDSNEASWTQVLEVLEFMSDATRVPILVDGDTGYGNFNNMRRLVRKLEQRGIAGVCIEDKIFPKTNSFIRGTTQALADIDEFCGRIRAGKEAQSSPDFVIVARVEAFIAGWGLEEAMKRAEAYRQAGADAILMHSARRDASEVLAFKQEWGDRLPVVIVPTKYYSTPTEVFREVGFSAVIWANHLMRSCITAMQRTAEGIFCEESLINVEDRVAPVAEVFRLQGASELAEAEKRYLPRHAAQTRAIVLAAAAGRELGELTADRPKAMVEVGGKPILAHILHTYRAAGVRDISIVRGYRKEAIDLDGVRYFDNDDAAETHEAVSLLTALPALEGRCVISYGDVLFKKFVAQELMDRDADFAIPVDSSWVESRNRNRYADYVICSEPHSRTCFHRDVKLVHIASELDPATIHGEWMGFISISPDGARFLRDFLPEVLQDPAARATMDMAGLMRALIAAGREIRVIYTTGNWLDIDSIGDVIDGGTFQ